MNVIELNRALRQLRLGGMAAVLETRLHQAQAEYVFNVQFVSEANSTGRAVPVVCIFCLPIEVCHLMLLIPRSAGTGSAGVLNK